MILPINAVGFTSQPNLVASEQSTVELNIELKSLTAEIVTAEPVKISMPVVLKPEPKPVVVARPVVVAVSRSYSPDPGPAGKRALAKRAAAAYGIDWKILEAVWQVESGKRWHSPIRSYAGATGPCQFMPGTWRAYAVDGNGDGFKDITYAPDCLFASARLLAANGAAQGENVRALLRYNNSMSYVNKVLAIAQSISD